MIAVYIAHAALLAAATVAARVWAADIAYCPAHRRTS